MRCPVSSCAPGECSGWRPPPVRRWRGTGWRRRRRAARRFPLSRPTALQMHSPASRRRRSERGAPPPPRQGVCARPGRRTGRASLRGTDSQATLDDEREEAGGSERCAGAVVTVLLENSAQRTAQARKPGNNIWSACGRVHFPQFCPVSRNPLGSLRATRTPAFPFSLGRIHRVRMIGMPLLKRGAAGCTPTCTPERVATA